ncbi:MAG: hypothetical protein KAU50_07640 [Candidatus Marinimicrobia bacterium]|nr:hypothetical protein [Candidatus Neomarinimicrobiota bacterium]
MIGIFDSPLLWIILIWWILTTVLGSKAKRKRQARQQAMMAQAADDSETGEDEQAADRLDTLPTGFPGGQPEQRPEPRSVSPLQEIWRNLGFEEGPFQIIAPVEEEPTAPEPVAEPVEPPRPPVEQILKPAAAGERDWQVMRDASKPYKARRRRPGLMELRTLKRLTPIQQAVVLKEVLDNPLALRQG